MLNNINIEFNRLDVNAITNASKLNQNLKTDDKLVKDKAEISDIAKQMASYPFLIYADRIANSDDYKFSFNYNDETIFNLNAQGVYYSKKKKIQTILNFTYQKEVIENGIKTYKTYEVKTEISYTLKDERSAETKKTKESVIDFIKRIIDRVIEIDKEDKSLIAGIVLDKEDLKDILSFDDENGNGKKLKDLISMLISFMQLKQLMDKDKNKEQVLYTPKRKENIITEINKSKEEDFEFNLSIKELKDKNIEKTKEKEENKSIIQQKEE